MNDNQAYFDPLDIAYSDDDFWVDWKVQLKKLPKTSDIDIELEDFAERWVNSIYSIYIFRDKDGYRII